MTIEQLNDIIAKANLKAIEGALKKAGFKDCKKDGKLRHASLYDITQAPYESTKSAYDSKGCEYVGELCHDVKGLEQYQFVIVELLKPVGHGSDIISTAKMLVYAKEI